MKEGYILIDTQNINEAKNLVEKAFKQEKKPAVIAKDDEFNRKILENKKVNILLFRDFKGRKDKLKQRDSGLNHVLCKLARDNKIGIGFDFSNLFMLDDKELSEHIARLIQNIKLCSKAKVNFIVFNAENISKHTLFAFFLSLGASTNNAKYAIDHKF